MLIKNGLDLLRWCRTHVFLLLYVIIPSDYLLRLVWVTSVMKYSRSLPVNFQVVQI